MQKTRLRFTWHLVADDFAESSDVQLLCRHAIRRGVRLPTAWKWTLIGEVPAADDMAQAAVQRARDDFALSDDMKLDCRHPVTNLAFAHILLYSCLATGTLAIPVSC